MKTRRTICLFLNALRRDNYQNIIAILKHGIYLRTVRKVELKVLAETLV